MSRTVRVNYSGFWSWATDVEVPDHVPDEEAEEWAIENCELNPTTWDEANHETENVEVL